MMAIMGDFQRVVNLKLCNLKFLHNLNVSFNFHPKKEKFIQIYLVNSKTLVIHNAKKKKKKKVPCDDNFCTVLHK
jgi:hypothetical protein